MAANKNSEFYSVAANKIVSLRGDKSLRKMDRKEVFKQVIIENQEYILGVELYERPFELEQEGCYVLVGVRQAGKSYLLYQTIQHLMTSGVSVNEIVYVNFDDERLCDMRAGELDVVLQAYHELYDNAKPLLFFDEIQNIDGWEHFARRLANQKYRVFITGSNAKMLSRDIATTLGGRYLTCLVYPYDFREFVEAQGVKVGKNWVYSKQKSAIKKLFASYFAFGGFPELVRFRDKRAWLNNIYGKIFFSDLVVRNNVKNEEALRMCVHRLADSVKQPLSYNRLANLLKSVGVKVSVSTIIDYIRYLKEGCLIFSIENYASKFVEKESVKKHYFVDNGLLNIFLTDAETSLLENLCAIHLYKQYADELYFYNRNIEVDFFLPREAVAIQVAYSLSDIATEAREVQAMLKLDKLHTLKRLLIITRDEEKTIMLNDGRCVEVKSVWKWLLGE